MVRLIIFTNHNAYLKSILKIAPLLLSTTCFASLSIAHSALVSYVKLRSAKKINTWLVLT